MTDAKKILFISQEIQPYMPKTEIAGISRYLPQAMQESGSEVRIFMPRYGLINERRNQLHEVIRLSGLNLIINDSDHPLIIKVASIQPARLQVYFIDNDDFFKRKNQFAKDGIPHKDNDERSIFFVRGTLETIKKLRWLPDIVHCHGAFTALATIYMKKMYHDDPCLKNAKVVYTLYNEEHPAEISEAVFDKMKFDKIRNEAVAVMDRQSDYAALCRLAIKYADGLVIGSKEPNETIRRALETVGDTPVLEYPGEEAGEAYNKFYNSLLAK